MKEKASKIFRILEMYAEFSEGKKLKKAELAQLYDVDKRTIERDIDDIQAFLSERLKKCGDQRELICCHKGEYKDYYYFIGQEAAVMSNPEILAVSKILLESRAFTEEEIRRILDKLIAGCAPAAEQQWIERMLANEKSHYVPLQHHKDVQDMMWKICRGIQEKALLKLCYRRQGEEKATGKRYIEPVTILFSEYYFYLLGYLLEWSEDEKPPKRKHDYPAVFRLDRIDDCQILNHKFYEKDYGNRFQGGEFRKRVQFMYPGELMLIGLRYTGKSVEAVLDRLPTAEIEREENGVYDIKAEVFGTGILMWLMSQGKDIEVLRPASLRRQMRERLEKTLELYPEVPLFFIDKRENFLCFCKHFRRNFIIKSKIFVILTECV